MKLKSIIFNLLLICVFIPTTSFSNERTLQNLLPYNDDFNGTYVDLEGDSDGDGVADGEDNCPTVYNQIQMDYDRDGVGNACEFLLYLDSDAGDYIGQGQELIYTGDDAEFTA